MCHKQDTKKILDFPKKELRIDKYWRKDVRFRTSAEPHVTHGSPENLTNTKGNNTWLTREPT
jgi:hypothetical protein